jgi:hypothetical protein
MRAAHVRNKVSRQVERTNAPQRMVTYTGPIHILVDKIITYLFWADVQIRQVGFVLFPAGHTQSGSRESDKSGA